MSDLGLRYVIWRYRLSIMKAHLRVGREAHKGYPNRSAKIMWSIPPMKKQLAELEDHLQIRTEARLLLASRRIVFDVLSGLVAMAGVAVTAFVGAAAHRSLFILSFAYLIVGLLFFRRAIQSYPYRSQERRSS